MTSLLPGRATTRSSLPSDLPPNAGRAALGIFVVLLAQLMLVLDGTVVNVALPHIATDLHFGDASLSWVLDGYTLAFGGLLLLGGRLGDVFGRRRVFLAGLATFTLFSFVGGLSVSPTMLVLARGMQGAGAALAAPSVLALLTTSAPDQAARNRALALFGAVSSGGGALGLILGGALTDLISWRWTLFINIPIGLFVLAVVPRLVAETPRRPGRFDIVGAASATLGSAALVWAVIEAPTYGWGSVRTIGGITAGLALIALLIRTEARVAHPLLRLGLLRNRRRVAGLLVMAFQFGAMMSMFFLLVQVLEKDLGFGPLAAGFAFLPMPLSIFTLSRITPGLVAKWGQPPLMIVGTLGLTTAFVRFSQLPDSVTYWHDIFPVLLIAGISVGATFMPITSIVLEGVEPEHAGSASGLLQTMQQLGGSVGLAVVASAFATHQVVTEPLAGIRFGFGTAALLAALALASALSLVVRPETVRGLLVRREVVEGAEGEVVAIEDDCVDCPAA